MTKEKATVTIRVTPAILRKLKLRSIKSGATIGKVIQRLLARA